MELHQTNLFTKPTKNKTTLKSIRKKIKQYENSGTGMWETAGLNVDVSLNDEDIQHLYALDEEQMVSDDNSSTEDDTDPTQNDGLILTLSQNCSTQRDICHHEKDDQKYILIDSSICETHQQDKSLERHSQKDSDNGNTIPDQNSAIAISEMESTAAHEVEEIFSTPSYVPSNQLNADQDRSDESESSIIMLADNIVSTQPDILSLYWILSLKLKSLKDHVCRYYGPFMRMVLLQIKLDKN